MRKWLIVGTALGLALLLVILPILVGFALERAYPVLIERLRVEVPNLGVVEERFERGLFSSSATTRVRFDAENGAQPSIVVDQNWVHGPLALPEWFSGFIPIPPVLTRARGQIRSAEGDRVSDLLLTVNLDGTLDVEAVSPPFASPDGSLSGDGMRAELAIQGGVRGARGQLQSGEVRLDSPPLQATLDPTTVRFHGMSSEAGSRVEGTFELGATRIEMESGVRVNWGTSFGTFNASRIPNELDSSAFDIDLGDFEISGADGPEALAIAESGRLQVDLRTEGRRVDRMQLVLSFDTLQLGARSLGPGLLRLTARGIDFAVLAEFREALEGVSGSEPVADATVDEGAGLLQEWIPILVAASPELKVERFELDGPDGRLEATGWLKIDGSDPGAFEQELTAMEAVQAYGELAIPFPALHGWLDLFMVETVADEAPGLPEEEILAMAEFMREMALGRLIETGFLRPKDDRYRIEFRFEQGVPVVNGKLLGPGGLAELLGGG